MIGRVNEVGLSEKFVNYKMLIVLDIFITAVEVVLLKCQSDHISFLLSFNGFSMALSESLNFLVSRELPLLTSKTLVLHKSSLQNIRS